MELIMNILAVIPAKSDSNRLEKKNMRKIGNKTLIEIAIDYAKKSKKINDVVVSTDSEEIAKDKLSSESGDECDFSDDRKSFPFPTANQGTEEEDEKNRQ